MQNGVGTFIRQCKRLDFHYCDWAGSSRGMKYASDLESSLIQSGRINLAFLANFSNLTCHALLPLTPLSKSTSLRAHIVTLSSEVIL